MYIGFPNDDDDVAAIVGFSINSSLSSSLPGSGTNEVLNLTKTSNVNIPGVWMFQVGRYGKCNDKGPPSKKQAGLYLELLPPTPRR